MERVYILIDKRAVDYGTDFGEDVIIHVDADRNSMNDFALDYFKSMDDCDSLDAESPEQALQDLITTGKSGSVYLINRRVHSI